MLKAVSSAHTNSQTQMSTLRVAKAERSRTKNRIVKIHDASDDEQTYFHLQRLETKPTARDMRE